MIEIGEFTLFYTLEALNLNMNEYNKFYGVFHVPMVQSKMREDFYHIKINGKFYTIYKNDIPNGNIKVDKIYCEKHSPIPESLKNKLNRIEKLNKIFGD